MQQDVTYLTVATSKQRFHLRLGCAYRLPKEECARTRTAGKRWQWGAAVCLCVVGDNNIHYPGQVHVLHLVMRALRCMNVVTVSTTNCRQDKISDLHSLGNKIN